MIKFNLHPAIIVDNNDPYQTGKVKIRISHLMTTVEDDLLPWVAPFGNGSGGSDEQGVSLIPEIDSMVWVFFMDDLYYRQGYYISDIHFSEKNIHSAYNDYVAGSVGAEAVYPYVKYLYVASGVCIAVSSDPDTPEITVFHPKASIFINKEGYLQYQDENSNNITINGDGVAIVDSNGNEFKSDGSKWSLNGHFTVEQ